MDKRTYVYVTYIKTTAEKVWRALTDADLHAETLRSISQGWPMVLSGLKTLLETGKPLPPIWGRAGGSWKRLRFEAAET